MTFCDERYVKRKSPGRLKSELRKKLRPEVDLPTLAIGISEFLDKHVGKSAQSQNLANNLATYLIQKYSISDRKGGELRSLIERHPDDIATFDFDLAAGGLDRIFLDPSAVILRLRDYDSDGKTRSDATRVMERLANQLATSSAPVTNTE